MKTIIIAIVMMLSAPAWAGDTEGWGPYYDSFGNPFRIIQGHPILRTQPPPGMNTRPTQYEHKVIPESELEKWLNEGWEFVSAYTIMAGSTRYPAHEPYNKAIIRREVKP